MIGASDRSSRLTFIFKRPRNVFKLALNPNFPPFHLRQNFRNPLWIFQLPSSSIPFHLPRLFLRPHAPPPPRTAATTMPPPPTTTTTTIFFLPPIQSSSRGLRPRNLRLIAPHLRIQEAEAFGSNRHWQGLNHLSKWRMANTSANYNFTNQKDVTILFVDAIEVEAFNSKTLFLIGCYTIGKIWISLLSS
ncbi:hypothetical protein SDJN03_01670, partial [Cucurbita argyrosperma subsp. sororia]